ncbi:MAG TPA: nuclear transport factor 2 family protein [Hyphomonadaceae bacterium]|nr:nuclear transport factor 2 family protein [Hyphomonadaceae bacterium]
MPTLERLKAFIAMVEAGDHVEAIEQFYHRDATMQENLGQKREGIEALVAGEKAALVRMGGVPASKCIRYAITGDTVMINWTFAMGGQFATPDGKPKLLDEVAVQVWRGDRIASERFYYDPSTLR